MEHKTKAKSSETTQLPTAEQQLFVATILNLTWQLLIVVVLPVFGGHLLDNRYDTAPAFTLMGFGLALSLAALVTYRSYKKMTNFQKSQETHHD